MKRVMQRTCFKSDEVLNVAVKTVPSSTAATRLALEGQLISLSASIGIVGPSNGSAVTDADGNRPLLLYRPLL